MVSVGSKSAGVKLTYADYMLTPDDERYELLDGDLIMVPAPGILHQQLSKRLLGILDAFVEERGLGEVFHAPCDVVLSDVDVVQPDLLFVSKEREGLLANGLNVQGAPDLVVEILSPSTAEKDKSVKRDPYARHGVREYWMVDPEDRTVSVMSLKDGGFETAGVYGDQDRVESVVLEGFEVRVNSIFEWRGRRR